MKDVISGLTIGSALHVYSKISFQKINKGMIFSLERPFFQGAMPQIARGAVVFGSYPFFKDRLGVVGAAFSGLAESLITQKPSVKYSLQRAVHWPIFFAISDPIVGGKGVNFAGGAGAAMVAHMVTHRTLSMNPRILIAGGLTKTLMNLLSQ